MAGARALSGALASLLFGITSGDPATFVAIRDFPEVLALGLGKMAGNLTLELAIAASEQHGRESTSNESRTSTMLDRTSAYCRISVAVSDAWLPPESVTVRTKV
jgi:hypothetical protein